MTGLRLDASHVLTWGMGGPERTVTGLTLAEASEQASTLRAWGPVIMRQWCGELFYAESGRPVADDNTTAVWLRHLDEQREHAHGAHQRAVARGVANGSPEWREYLREWAAEEMADLPDNTDPFAARVAGEPGRPVGQVTAALDADERAS